MGVETENYEIAAKGIENTRSWFPFLVVQMSHQVLPVGYLKGQYKSLPVVKAHQAEQWRAQSY